MITRHNNKPGTTTTDAVKDHRQGVEEHFKCRHRKRMYASPLSHPLHMAQELLRALSLGFVGHHKSHSSWQGNFIRRVARRPSFTLNCHSFVLLHRPTTRHDCKSPKPMTDWVPVIVSGILIEKYFCSFALRSFLESVHFQYPLLASSKTANVQGKKRGGCSYFRMALSFVGRAHQSFICRVLILILLLDMEGDLADGWTDEEQTESFDRVVYRSIACNEGKGTVLRPLSWLAIKRFVGIARVLSFVVIEGS